MSHSSLPPLAPRRRVPSQPGQPPDPACAPQRAAPNAAPRRWPSAAQTAGGPIPAYPSNAIVN